MDMEMEWSGWAAVALTALTSLATVLVISFKFFARLDKIIETSEETARLVRYHLGPNGDSPQMYKQVRRIQAYHLSPWWGRRKRLLKDMEIT